MDIQGLRDKILQLAIQGKLVEQDENDEPASALVQRIKEERDKLVREKKIKKPKKLAPIEEGEKPFEIPGSWEWVRLGEVGLTQTGTTPSTKHPEYFNGTIPFIKPADISEKGIDYNNESLTELGLLKGRLIGKNSVLMVCIGGSIGKCYFTNRDVSCNQQINTITPYKAVSNKILYYFMISDFFYNSVLKSATGTATPIINKSKWDMLLIPLPPLAEQKRIVEKIDQLFALIDELDSNKEDLLEVINLTRNQVLQEAIRGKLVEQNPEDEPASVLLDRIKEERNKLIKEKKIRKPKKLPPIEEEEKPFEIPGSWEWVRLGEVALVNMGQSPKGNTVNDNEGMEFHQGKVHFGERYLNKSDKYTTNPKKIAQPNDILLSVRAPVGTVNIVDREICIGRGLCAISSLGDVDKGYYFYTILALEEYLIKKATGTTFLAVTASTVNQMVIPLPPFAEQKRIVEKIDIIMDMLDKLERTIME